MDEIQSVSSEQSPDETQSSNNIPEESSDKMPEKNDRNKSEAEYVENITDNDFNIISSDDGYPTVVWAINSDFNMKINKAILDRINERLHEDGIEYSVQLVVMRNDMITRNGPIYAPYNYYNKIDYYEEHHQGFDIVSAGGGYTQETAAMFLESGRFMKLNDYLASEEGTALYELFDEKDWRATSVNGDFYSVPMNSGRMDENSKYICFNKKYIDDISDFDGSFVNLNGLYEKYGSGKKIILANYGDICFMSSRQGWNYLSYDCQENKIYDTLLLDEFKENMDMVSKAYDKGKGYLVCNNEGDEIDEDDTFAFTYNGDVSGLEDKFIVYEYSKNVLGKKCLFTQAVSEKSEKKEAALKILEKIYTDQEIANALLYGLKEADYEIRDDRVVTHNANPDEFAESWMQGNNLCFGTYYFATPVSYEENDDRYALYKKGMDGYEAGWETDFCPSLTLEECKLLDLYFQAAGDYYVDYFYHFSFPANTLGIKSLEELSESMKPVIDKINAELNNK